MANTTTRLYIRCATGYSTPSKKLVDLPARVFTLFGIKATANAPGALAASRTTPKLLSSTSSLNSARPQSTRKGIATWDFGIAIQPITPF
jgi:hypothetical protein